jgi:hypothetical protein
MRQSSSLDELFMAYKAGTLEKRDLEGLIFKTIITNKQHFHIVGRNDEHCMDFLCWLYPRLSRAIDTYKNVGSSFDSYIISLIRWSMREYHTREAKRYMTEYACWEARTEELAACEPEPEYMEPSRKPKPLDIVPNPRQVLILLLKSYYFVSDDFISRVAPALGLEKERLKELVDELRKQRQIKDEELRSFQERLHCQYFRCIAYARRLHALSEGSACYERLKLQLARAKARYKRMKARFVSTCREPSNRQIADVLGVPKGTVDSNLYTLKRNNSQRC